MDLNNKKISFNSKKKFIWKNKIKNQKYLNYLDRFLSSGEEYRPLDYHF